MNKIHVFFGPANEFDKIIPKDNSISLTEFVRKFENAWKADYVESFLEDYDEINFVAYSEEFTGVREHFIENFLNVLSLVDINNLFVHNPPLSLLNRVQRKFNDCTDIKHYEYPTVSKDAIVLLKKKISKYIVGQEKAKSELLTSLYTLARRKDNRPLILMFYGPSGVGKTETAKCIGSILNIPLFRKQLSMFQTNDFYSYLFGGQNEKTSFAKDLIDRDSNIILLDEFDKAQPILFSAFYQMFDEGEYVDKNYSVRLHKSIIICTSNYASRNEIRQNLGDPIYFRFDNFIKFDPLNRDHKRMILEKEFEKQLDMLDEQETKIVEEENLRSILTKRLDKMENFRDIEKTVENVVSAILVKHIDG